MLASVSKLDLLQKILNWDVLELNKPRLHLYKDVLRKSSNLDINLFKQRYFIQKQQNDF